LLSSLAFLFVLKLVLWIGTRGGRKSFYESCKLENAIVGVFLVTFGVPFIFAHLLSFFIYILVYLFAIQKEKKKKKMLQ